MNEPTSRDPQRRVSIGILTFQRPAAIERAVLSVLDAAVPGDDAAWQLLEILVVDNDRDESARDAVKALSDVHHQVRYVCESSPGIAAARNRALDEAAGDVLVFIDDDEVAQPGWPAGLLEVMTATGAAMVGGPVTTEFTNEPPQWVRDGGYFDRANPPERTPQEWLRSGNVAIDVAKTNPANIRFDESFKIGEDAHFSMQVKRLGMGLSWSDRAAVVEYVDADRLTLEWRDTREFTSSEAWSRATIDIDNSAKTKLGVLARAAVRFVQGIGLHAAAALTRNGQFRAKGITYVARAKGTFAGFRAAQSR